MNQRLRALCDLAASGVREYVSRHEYDGRIEDLSPDDLPALIEADRQKTEEEHQKGRERADFARDARAGLERIHVLEPAEEMSQARTDVHR